MSKRVRTKRCSMGLTMKPTESIFIEAPDGSGYCEIRFRRLRGNQTQCVITAPRNWPIRRKAEHLPGIEAGAYPLERNED